MHSFRVKFLFELLGAFIKEILIWTNYLSINELVWDKPKWVVPLLKLEIPVG